MEPSAINLGKLAGPSKIFARRLLAIGANRIELLMVEVQEERGRLLHALLLGCGIAASAFLAVLALNAALVVLFWETSRVAALAVSGSSTPRSPSFSTGSSAPSCAIGRSLARPSTN